MSLTYGIGAMLRFLKGKKRPYTTAVILAGGEGSRMNGAGGVTKQLMSVGGVPVLVRSLFAFDASEYIDEIVVVARKEEMKEVARLAKMHGVKKLVRIVSGGETRALSALRGLEAASPKTQYIAIHDAARCLITPKMIALVASAAYVTRAASAACSSVDTLKLVNTSLEVQETLDRESVYRAQTPQIFEIGLYRAAAYSARKDGVAATDDNMLVERLGHRVKMVDTGEENIKITRSLDVAIAEAILKVRAEAKGDTP